MIPLGRHVVTHLVLGVGRVVGYAVQPDHQTTLFEAGERLWASITPLLGHPLGRQAFPRLVGAADPPTARLVRHLLGDPRIRPGPAPVRAWALLCGAGFARRMMAHDGGRGPGVAQP